MKSTSTLNLSLVSGTSIDVVKDRFSQVEITIGGGGNYRTYPLRTEEARELADALLYAAGKPAKVGP